MFYYGKWLVLLVGIVFSCMTSTIPAASTPKTPNAILIMSSPANPTRSEAVLLAKLPGIFIGNIDKKTAEQVSEAEWADYDLVIAIEADVLGSERITGIINSGGNILLLKSALGSVGGNLQKWTSNMLKGREMIIDENLGFLDGYKSTLSVMMQEKETVYYFKDSFPAGWTSIARNTNNLNEKTAFSRENARSGGKGVIMGYDPAHISGAGWNFLALAVNSLAPNATPASVMIPEGNAVFVISAYEIGADPELSQVETAHYNLLLNLGFEVSFIPFSSLRNTDLATASLISAAQYPSIDAVSANILLSQGHKLWLQYSAGASMGGKWYNYEHNAQTVRIMENIGFMDGYKSDFSMTVQTRFDSYNVSSPFPTGWIGVGARGNSNTLQTMFIREDNSGGKALICSYNPQELSETGKGLIEMIYAWLDGRPAAKGSVVPKGNVVFVISGFKDDTVPTLTDAENSLYSKLLHKGFKITPLRWSRVAQSDLSSAALVVAAGYPSLSNSQIDSLTRAKIPLLLTFNAGSVVGGGWRISDYNKNTTINPVEIKGPLQIFPDSKDVRVQENDNSCYISNTSYPDWQALAYAASKSSHTVLGHKNAPAVVVTYTPAAFNEAGWQLIDSCLDWLLNR